MKNSTTQRQGDPLEVGGWQTAWAAIRGHRFAEGEGGAAPAGGGEGGTGGDGGQQAPGAAPTPPTPPAAPSPAILAAQAAAQAQQQGTQATGADPDPEMFSRDYVHELREEAKTNRVSRQEAETRATAAEQQLAEAQAQLAAFQRESAVRAASEGIANPALLLDSASFQQTISQVDPADTQAVKTAIQAFVEQNSAYAANPLPGSSGGTPTGGTGQTPKTLEGAIAARLGS